MVGIAEISAGLGSLRAAKDIIQGLNAANLKASINDIKIELQGHILEAQQALFSAQEVNSAAAARITQLEQEIARLKDWSSERERYQLTQIDRDTLAYTLKPGMENDEAPHWLCTACFQDGRKGILQYQGNAAGGGGRGMENAFRCGTCSSQFVVSSRRHLGQTYDDAAREA